MSVIRTTFNGGSVETGGYGELALTDREARAFADAVLDGTGTALVNDDGDLVAYALERGVVEKMQRPEPEPLTFDYALDILTDIAHDVENEVDPAWNIDLLREELLSLQCDSQEH